MNIAIVSPWAISETSVGGTERFTIDLATQLHKLGNNVEVFVLSGRSCRIREVQYTSLDMLGGERIADEYDLKTFAANNEGVAFYHKWASFLEANIDISTFDVVQLNSLLFVDAWKNKPRLFTIHTNPFEYRLDWGQRRLDCVVQKIRDELPNQTLLLTPSEHYSKRFSKTFNRDVLTVPHAIDVSRLDDAARIRASTHSDASADMVNVLLPSRLELVQKRPQIVFRGIASLPKQFRDRINVIAAGKDPQYQDNCQKLERIAQESGFRAQFVRFKSMSEAYAAADIVALPSKSESFGYAALESLSLGIPTILNDLPTFREIGTGNSNAHFFDHTAQAFSLSLLALLQNLQSYPTDKAWLQRYDIRLWAETYQKLAGSIVA